MKYLDVKLEIHLDRTWGVNFIPTKEYIDEMIKNAPKWVDKIIIKPVFNNPAGCFSGYDVEYPFPSRKKIKHYSPES